jgi:nucleotide-binding universal stress UspA family protein
MVHVRTARQNPKNPQPGGTDVFKPIKNILFATNLTENCLNAFHFAASLATRYQATLVLLHVIEKMPDYVEGRLKGLLGEQQWKQMTATHANEARQVLIGKQSSGRLIREALEKFCADAGIDDNSCGYHSREIVVSDGEIIEEVINQSKSYNCDLIVLGTREGFLSSNSIGPTIKGIMRQSKVPVMMVPPEQHAVAR